jgi:aminoglycoside 6'-N-acetyltransferase
MSPDRDTSLAKLPAGVAALTGARVRLVPARDEHIPAFTALFSDPTVRRWWPAPDPVVVAREHVAPEANRVVWAIEVEGAIVGIIQAWEETEADYRHAGIDLSLLGSAQGRGLGPDAIRAVARWLFEVRRHHRITIDPSAANAHAIRAYVKVGFRPVGVMRNYERGPDGTWHDGLLMDLLPGDLVDG